ncbi:Protein GPR15L, partial [Chytridiales sp. JEL 0842]
ATLSDCTLTFTPENWNVPKQVNVAANPDFDDKHVSTKLTLTAVLDGPCEATRHKCEQKIDINRKYRKGKACQSTGDPHYSTFDGLTYSFQGHGAFYLVKSDLLSVQAYQYPCLVQGTLQTTCNGAVAVKYKNSAAILSITKNGNWDSKDKNSKPTLQRISPNIDDMVYTEKGNGWTLTMDDGASVTITVGSQQNMFWLDVSIFLPACYTDKVGGLCNFHKQEEDSEKVFKCRNGKKIKHAGELAKNLIDEFGGSWVVDGDDHMFSGKWKKDMKHPITYKPKPGCKPVHNRVCPPRPTTTTQVITTTTRHVITTTTTLPVTTTTTLTTTTNGAPTTTVTTLTTMMTTTSTTTQNVLTTTTVTTTIAPPTTTMAPPRTTAALTTTRVGTTTTTCTTTTTAAPPKPTLPPYVPGIMPSPPATTTRASTIAAAPSTIPSNNTNSPCVGLNCSSANPKDRENAVNHCTKILKIPGCETICPKKLEFFIQACVADILVTGSYIFCEAQRQSLNNYCQKLTGYMAVSANPVVQQMAVTVQKEAGYDSFTCINNCSGQGRCGATGCTCNAPWSGTDCSVDQSKLAKIVAPGLPAGSLFTPSYERVDGNVTKDSYAAAAAAASASNADNAVRSDALSGKSLISSFFTFAGVLAGCMMVL